jgi:hypothetical protein
VTLNEGATVDMLTPGILWVDRNSFQITRTRTDLLAQRNDIRLDQLTTEVRLVEVDLVDIVGRVREESPATLPARGCVPLSVLYFVGQADRTAPLSLFGVLSFRVG